MPADEQAQAHQFDPDLSQAPLPDGPLADSWRQYVDEWSAGRPAANKYLLTFVRSLTANPKSAIDFADWVFRTLFDTEAGLAQGAGGQWGGGMEGVHTMNPSKPSRFAILKYPLTGQILLPFILNQFEGQAAVYARWLYLFATGPGYRLPPRETEMLNRVTESYSDDWGLTQLLELGSGVDPRARRLLVHLNTGK